MPLSAKQLATLNKFRSIRKKAQSSLDRNKHYGIYVRVSRATIGEIYNRARTAEALLTLRYLDPIIVPADALLEHITKARAASMPTDELYAELKLIAKAWAKKRQPVRHPKWNKTKKEPA